MLRGLKAACDNAFFFAHVRDTHGCLPPVRVVTAVFLSLRLQLQTINHL